MSEKVPPEDLNDNALARAEAELQAAEKDLAAAESDVHTAKEDIELVAAEENRREYHVHVVYDGQSKKFEVREEEVVTKLLEQAIAAFGAGPNPHTLSLFNDGQELSDTDTIKAAGVEPHDKLLLRPSKVKGGA